MYSQGERRGAPKQEFQDAVNAEVIKNFNTMDADELKAAQMRIISQAQSNQVTDTLNEQREKEKDFYTYLIWGTLISFNITVLWALWYAYTPPKDAVPPKVETVTNWSNTHSTTTKRYFEPDSEKILEDLVAGAYEGGQRIRPIGSALSPNAVGFSSDGMVSMGLMNKVLSINEKKKWITVEAGIRVEEVVEALRPYGLTLQNFASVKEQQIGGFTQVGAHGTGASIPPVDEQVVALKIVTPGRGTMKLALNDQDPLLFKYCRLALGALGIVSEVTLQCVPAHRLLEHTFVTSRSEVKKNHKKWLQKNQHLRYMWIPYTDSVVVVACNPTEGTKLPRVKKTYTQDEQLEPLRNLLLEKRGDSVGTDSDGDSQELEGGPDSVYQLTWAQLREQLLMAGGILEPDWVQKVNEAEAEFWKRSEGYRIDWSDKILGFDCGGQQHVLEVAFPCGTITQPDGNDILFMEQLLSKIEKQNIPAPAPIEQRWTCGSTSPMSPVYNEEIEDAQKSVYSWVGIIMYLPTDDEETRNMISDKFGEYSRMLEMEIMPEFNATYHWAKIEVPMGGEELGYYQRMLARRYPLTRFNYLRVRLDPRNILSNRMINAGFSTPHGTWYM